MAISRGDTAILVIDVQKRFCDPDGPIVDVGNGPQVLGNAKTDAISKRIQSRVSEFRKAGIQVYVVYCEGQGKGFEFHEFTPETGDVMVPKNLNNANSAFKSSNIEETLKKDGKKSLLFCGFSRSNCVGEALLDAHKAGFKVTLLDDLSDGSQNDMSPVCNEMRERRKKGGLTVEQSGDVLERLRARQKKDSIFLPRPAGEKGESEPSGNKTTVRAAPAPGSGA